MELNHFVYQLGQITPPIFMLSLLHPQFFIAIKAAIYYQADLYDCN